MSTKVNRSRAFAAMVGIWAVIPLVVSAGCSSKDEEAKIRINVTLSESAESLDSSIHRLLFFVAYSLDGPDGSFTTDTAATGTEAVVDQRSLLNDPFRLLIEEDGDRRMETIKVLVLAYSNGQRVAWGELQDPHYQSFISETVVDRTIHLYAEADDPLPYRESETGCLFYSNSLEVAFASPRDRDCDGYPKGEDCDDTNPEVHPEAQEICDNLVDDNCNGVTDEEVDQDDDGITNCQGDCNDNDPDVYPGAPEICDGKDNDCNGRCDELFDGDGDGMTACIEGPFAGRGTYVDGDGVCLGEPTYELFDCKDDDYDVNPWMEELCDGKDNNCNDVCDEGFDEDEDGWSVCGSMWVNSDGVRICQQPNAEDIDCRDDDPNIHPGAKEICDGYDTNCISGDEEMHGLTMPCLVLSSLHNNRCAVGSWTCDETDGVGWSECVTTASGMVHPDIDCEIFDICSEIYNRDEAWDCVSNASAGSFGCRIFTDNNSQLCTANPMSDMPIDTNDLATCYFRLLGLSQAPHWEVALWVYDDQSSDYVPAGEEAHSCDVRLMAYPVTPVAQDATITLLFLGMPAQVTVYDVLLTVEEVICEGSGMECGD